jgi:hypothetical protein
MGSAYPGGGGTTRKALLAFMAGAAAVWMPAVGWAENDLVEAVKNGKPIIDVRYRFEFADQDGKTENANAHTVRTQLGWETAPFYDFSLLLEFENNTVIGGENFNDTINGKTQFPVVADPEGTEVNQVYLTFEGLPDSKLQFGRRAINLDNQRWIGSVGFRQNEQTFDSVTLANSSLDDLTAQYSYVFGIQRIFGDDSVAGDFNTDTHIVHLAYDGLELGTLTGYGYLIDLDDDAPGLSSKTFGLRFKGWYALDEIKLLYTAEFAHQSDYANNPSDFGLPYIFLEPGISWRGLTAKLGYESLGGDGNDAVQMPYATLHAFQGWADKFLRTPDAGISDVYATVKFKAGKWNLTGVYHDFSSDVGSTDYGTEFDVAAATKLSANYSILFKGAFFSGEPGGIADTNKFWIMFTANY